MPVFQVVHQVLVRQLPRVHVRRHRRRVRARGRRIRIVRLVWLVDTNVIGALDRDRHAPVFHIRHVNIGPLPGCRVDHDDRHQHHCRQHDPPDDDTFRRQPLSQAPLLAGCTFFGSLAHMTPCPTKNYSPVTWTM